MAGTASGAETGTSAPGRGSVALRRRWIRRSVPMSPALALPDMEQDRRVERLARRSGVPLLWKLEHYTAGLAEGATGADCRQWLDSWLALGEIPALVETSPPVSVGSFRGGGLYSRFTWRPQWAPPP